MRIAFVTGCLEPGRDGVGDYTRQLARVCARRGHEVRLMSVAEPKNGWFDAEIPSLRMSGVEWRADGGRVACQWLDDFAPDWTSLQFVPYSFDPRGLFGRCVGALSDLVRTAPRRHMFVHEIWIGSNVGALWKARLVGWRQRRALARLFRRIRPAMVHTNTAYHADALATLGQPAKVLPLFGHVSVRAGAKSAALPEIADDALVCGMFGNIYEDWAPDDFLADFVRLAANLGRPPALVSAGGMGVAGTAIFARVAEKWRHAITCHALGHMTEDMLSRVFARFDFAVTTMPWIVAGKSSSAASLRMHGLRVVVTATGSPPRFPMRTTDEVAASGGFVPYFLERTLAPTVIQRTSPGPNVEWVADRFLADLSDDD